MTYPERPNPNKFAVVVTIIILLVMLFYAVTFMSDFFHEDVPVDDPERDYTIIVRFILFFKQSVLI